MPCAPRGLAAAPHRYAPPGRRRSPSHRRTAALAACGSRVFRDGDPAAGVGGLVSMLDHDRDAADVLEVRGGGVDRIAPVEGGDERREEAGEPAVVRRLVELGREIVSLEPAPALEPQLAADPLDGAVLAREADAILALARSPGEEHRDQPLGALEVHRRGVRDLVGAVAQAAGPGAHRGYEVEDTASVHFEYPERLVTMFFTWAARQRENRIRFAGEHGAIEWVGGELRLERGGRLERHDFSAELDKAAYHRWFAGLFASFIASLDRGDPVHAAAPYLEDIRRVAVVVEHAYQAANTRCRVAIPENA